MPITPEISAKLLELKRNSCLTFEQIGAEVGTSDANARRYIMGETKTPDRQLLFSIIRCIGGDPEEFFGKKPLPQPTSASGIDMAFYDKLIASMEARYARQEELHKESLALWHQRHEKEVLSLQASMEQTIRSKDSWIEKLKVELDKTEDELDRSRQTVRHLIVVMVVLAALFAVLFLAYPVRDILDNTFGYLTH